MRTLTCITVGVLFDVRQESVATTRRLPASATRTAGTTDWGCVFLVHSSGGSDVFLNGHLASRFQVVAVEQSTPDKCEQLPGTLDTLQRLWSTVVQGDV